MKYLPCNFSMFCVLNLIYSCGDWGYPMEYVKTHMLMDLLWNKYFEVLITHIIGYWYFKWCLYIVSLRLFLKRQNSFLPRILFLIGSNISVQSTGNVLVVRLYLSWIFVFINPSMPGASSTSGFPDLLRLNISLADFLIFL